MPLRKVLHNAARAVTKAVVLALLLLAVTLPAMAQTATTLKVNFSIVADSTTAIPFGTGSFTTFNPIFLDFPPTPIAPPNPCMSNGNVAFWGAGSAQQGIYADFFGSLNRIADLGTTIPTGGGTICFIGDCATFPSFSPTPALSGNNVLFDAPTGIYSLYPPGPVAPVADLNTLIPSGIGTFTSYPPSPVLSGLNLAFIGDGVGQEGVYAAYPPTPIFPPSPIRVADLTTAIPGGDFGLFTAFPTLPPNPLLPPDPVHPPGPVNLAMSGLNVAFLGDGLATEGVYVVFPPGPVLPPSLPPSPIRVVDTTALMPGTTSLFNFFSGLSMDGVNLAFVGGVDNDALQAEGVFVAAPPNPITPSSFFNLTPVATTATVVPGGTTTFTAFGSVAIDPTNVVFEGFSFPGGVEVKGLYTNLGGKLTKIVDTTGSINGRQIAALNFGRNGFSGTQVAFEAEFTDGSQAVAVATLSGNRCPQSQGFWKNNSGKWPETTLILGNQSYSQSELLNILGTSTVMDASMVLARQLIAAKLNIQNFSNPAPVGSTITTSDNLLSGFSGKLPYSVKTSSTTGMAMTSAANVVQNYNADKLTPGCTQ
jgi:hypothetical protein